MQVAKPFTVLTVIFLLFWGVYAFFCAWSVPIVGGTEPAWLIPLSNAITRASALPEDWSRAIGQSVFGVALAALAVTDQTFSNRIKLLMFFLIMVALVTSVFGLWFLKPTEQLANEFVGGRPFLEVMYGMSRKVMELSLSLGGAIVGLKVLK